MATTFTTPALERKPSQVCIGRVTSVGDARPSKNNPDTYYVIDIQLEAHDAGKDQKVYFTWRPDFIKVMDSVELKRLEEDHSKLYFTYKMNIATQDEGKQSLLQGLTMTTERFNDLASRLLSLGQENIEANPTLVSDVLRQYLVEENGDTDLGYIVKQQTQKVGVDDSGKGIYEPTKFWEVEKFFEPNEKNIASFRKAAERNPRRYKITFGN